MFFYLYKNIKNICLHLCKGPNYTEFWEDTCCFGSKPELVKGDLGRKSRPLQIRAAIGEMSE